MGVKACMLVILIGMALMSGGVGAQLEFQKPTRLEVSPATMVVNTGEQLTLTATLRDALGNPLPDKSIIWSSAAGATSPTSCITDAGGRCSVTYIAPSYELPEGDIITASFAGDQSYQGSKGVATVTVKGRIAEKVEAKIPPVVLTELYPPYFVVGDDKGYRVGAVVIHNAKLEEVELLFKVNNGPWREVPAEFISGVIPQDLKEAVGRYAKLPAATEGYYEAEIPAQSSGSIVWYKFRAVDIDGNEMESTMGVYFVVEDESKTRVMVVDPGMELWWAKENLLHFKNLTEHFTSYMIPDDAIEQYLKLSRVADKYSAYVVQRHHWEFLAKRYNVVVVNPDEMVDVLKSFKPSVILISNIWLDKWDLSEHGMDRLVRYIREKHAGVIATHGTLFDQLLWKKCTRKEAEKIGPRGQVGDRPEIYLNPDEETIALSLGLFPMPLFEYLRDKAAEYLCQNPNPTLRAAGKVLGSTPLLVPYVPFSGNLLVEEGHPIVEGLPGKFSIKIPSAYSELGIPAYTTVGWQYILPANISKVVHERSEIAKEKARSFLHKVSEYYGEATGRPAPYKEMLTGVEGNVGVALARMEVSPELEASFTLDGANISTELDERVVGKIVDKLPVRVVVLSDDMLAGIVVDDEWYRRDGHRSVYFSFEVEASDDEVSEKLLTNAVEWAKDWEYTLPRDLRTLARETYNMTLSGASGVVYSTSVDFAIAHSVLEGIPTAKLGMRVLLGSAAQVEGAEFTRDTLTYIGRTYMSRWGMEDYCIIQPSKGKVNIVGTHRFGTKAGLLYYQKYSPKGTVVLRWRDKNGDKDVQLGEVEVVAEY